MNRRCRAALLVGCVATFCAAGCGDDDGGGPDLGFVNIDDLDPSFETYTGVSSDLIFENGYPLRILAADDPVHEGAVSVHFDDVENHGIRFPSDNHPAKVPLEPGGTYTVHAWVQAVDVGGGASTDDLDIAFAAAYYSDASTFVSTSPEAVRHVGGFGAWDDVSFTFTVPAGIDRGYISITGTANAALDIDLYIDDLSIERVDS